ncbi:unnamed protein product, partial [Mesorhabditis spiculigera]
MWELAERISRHPHHGEVEEASEDREVELGSESPKQIFSGSGHQLDETRPNSDFEGSIDLAHPLAHNAEAHVQPTTPKSETPEVPNSGIDFLPDSAVETFFYQSTPDGASDTADQAPEYDSSFETDEEEEGQVARVVPKTNEDHGLAADSDASDFDGATTVTSLGHSEIHYGPEHENAQEDEQECEYEQVHQQEYVHEQERECDQEREQEQEHVQGNEYGQEHEQMLLQEHDQERERDYDQEHGQEQEHEHEQELEGLDPQFTLPNSTEAPLSPKRPEDLEDSEGSLANPHSPTSGVVATNHPPTQEMGFSDATPVPEDSRMGRTQNKEPDSEITPGSGTLEYSLKREPETDKGRLEMLAKDEELEPANYVPETVQRKEGRIEGNARMIPPKLDQIGDQKVQIFVSTDSPTALEDPGRASALDDDRTQLGRMKRQLSVERKGSNELGADETLRNQWGRSDTLQSDVSMVSSELDRSSLIRLNYNSNVDQAAWKAGHVEVDIAEVDRFWNYRYNKELDAMVESKQKPPMIELSLPEMGEHSRKMSKEEILANKAS